MKPSVEYLDSLNEYRKRSRSHEGLDAANKAPKIEEVVNDGFGSASGRPNGYNNNGVAVAADTAMAEAAVEEPKEDPIVYGAPPVLLFSALSDDNWILVNGAPMPYSQVTEAEHDLMTPEEYTAFFQIMQEQM